MTSLHFNCSSGASGDMVVGSLLDLGASIRLLREGLEALELGNFSFSVRRVDKCGVSATKFDVFSREEETPRSLEDITEIVDGSRLPWEVKDLSLRVFRSLGEAEARAHRVPISDVHFHEVGAVDSIVDVVSASILLSDVGADEVSCGTISLGSGKAESAHGVFDVPAPAVRLLLADAPTRPGDALIELTTPTGAAILKAVAGRFSDEAPEGKKGFGAGMRDLPAPNVLEARLF